MTPLRKAAAQLGAGCVVLAIGGYWIMQHSHAKEAQQTASFTAALEQVGVTIKEATETATKERQLMQLDNLELQLIDAPDNKRPALKTKINDLRNRLGLPPKPE